MTLRTLCLLLSLSFSLSCAQDRNTWTDPELAARENPDFLVQGEYGIAEQGEAYGLHVIARGNGEFEAFLLEGGLPGLGHTREKSRTRLSGKTNDDSTLLKSDDGRIEAEIAGGQAAIVRDGEKIAGLPRIERSSPTLGARPPENAIVLFEGTDANEWNKPEAFQDGLLANLDISTKRKFHSYKLHLEFRLPFKPFARGQGRGNSGVYHQHRYETQVLDSFGLVGQDNETGGIYKISAPIVNACLPPLTWQTYDVEFTKPTFDEDGKVTEFARLTVHLNGVLVQDDTELPRTTGGARLKLDPEPGPIFLQHHGNPVFYRNIWIVEK